MRQGSILFLYFIDQELLHYFNDILLVKPSGRSLKEMIRVEITVKSNFVHSTKTVEILLLGIGDSLIGLNMWQ